MSDNEHFYKTLRLEELFAQRRILRVADEIADLCGSYSVDEWFHQHTIRPISSRAVYYGDTPMFHPETGEVVSFLDWLWETTDSYEQMVKYIGLLASVGVINSQDFVDERAYNMAGDC